jgi:hypothetical protein
LGSGQAAAIDQVIQCLDEIRLTNEHSNQLYGISAIGKRWRTCHALGMGGEDGQVVEGVFKVSSLTSAEPERWNLDITSDDSWAAFGDIDETIKGYAVAM